MKMEVCCVQQLCLVPAEPSSEHLGICNKVLVTPGEDVILASPDHVEEGPVEGGGGGLGPRQEQIKHGDLEIINTKLTIE